jgi:hypothetical protein
MNRFNTILHKIKAHDTNQFNNEVDELSKQARKDETLPPPISTYINQDLP